MTIEIEKKAWIPSIAKLEDKVSSMMTFLKQDLKKDTYYFKGALKDIDFVKDSIFRIREDKNGVFINYKDRSFSGNTEINMETEFPIINPENLEKLFLYMGYEILIKKNKKSRVYQYKNATVELNEIDGLGNFIEVEVLAEDADEKENAIEIINEIFNLLDIPEKDIENRYYIDLLLKQK